VDAISSPSRTSAVFRRRRLKDIKAPRTVDDLINIERCFSSKDHNAIIGNHANRDL
jgi:hypothetical protein